MRFLCLFLANLRLGVNTTLYMSAVVAQNLTKRFGDFTAVDNISFTVQKGEIFGFLGPNGSGKTTTIRMILGLVRPTAGRIQVLHYDVAQEAAAIRKRAGYMSQKFSLYPELTVAENLRFFAGAYGVRGERFLQRQAAILEMAGLRGHEKQLTRNLSGGWKQRLALGAAILHEPEILFLDEPTAGVDPVSRRAFWDLLYDLAATGTTIFVTTHYMDEAEHCQTLAFIYQGNIIAQGTPQLIKEARLHGDVLEIDCRQPETAVSLLRQAAADKSLNLQEVALYGSLLHVIATDAAGQEPAIAAYLTARGISIQGMARIAPSLEDTFVSLVKGQKTLT